MQTNKLLAKRRKAYILDAIYKRSYFREVQEEVLGQRIKQGISTPRTKGLSVLQCSIPEKEHVG